jgi:hypothetical protein
MSYAANNNPTQDLLFFVSQDIDENIRIVVHNFVARLRATRQWLLGAPEFVNEVQEPEDDSKGDEAVETVGGVLRLYAATPTLRREVDLAHFEEVSDLIAMLSELSLRHDIDFEFELDCNHVGAIQGGVPNRLLTVGLLGEWKRKLATN